MVDRGSKHSKLIFELSDTEMLASYALNKSVLLMSILSRDIASISKNFYNKCFISIYCINRLRLLFKSA